MSILVASTDPSSIPSITGTRNGAGFKSVEAHNKSSIQMQTYEITQHRKK